MRFRPAGPRAVLVELASLDEARAYAAEARRRQAAGSLPPAVEIVGGARTVLFDGADDVAAIVAAVRAWQPPHDGTGAGREVEIPVCYDGADLADVAARWGFAPEEVGERHAALAHEVAFLGFSPGFAYLAGLPRALQVPRLERPRTEVPAGSVGIAGEYTGVYPRRSPGGWRLLGCTKAVLWDSGRDPPSLLAPGDRVRFVPVPPPRR